MGLCTWLARHNRLQLLGECWSNGDLATEYQPNEYVSLKLITRWFRSGYMNNGASLSDPYIHADRSLH